MGNWGRNECGVLECAPMNGCGMKRRQGTYVRFCDGTSRQSAWANGPNETAGKTVPSTALDSAIAAFCCSSRKDKGERYDKKMVIKFPQAQTWVVIVGKFQKVLEG